MISPNFISQSFNVPTYQGMGDLGLFDNPTDISTWGFAEWAIALGVVYVGAKVIGDIKGAASTVKKSVRKRSSKAKRRQKLQEELDSL